MFTCGRVGYEGKEQNVKHSMWAVLVVAGVVFATGSLSAKDRSIAGTWTFSAERMNVTLVLEQQKTMITGTLDYPHGDPITLTGVLAGDTLVMFGDSAGENFTIHVNVTGMRKADGTLVGALKAHFDEFNDAHTIVRTMNQEIPWTAMRGLHDVVRLRR